jgi:hypothetical protein
MSSTPVDSAAPREEVRRKYRDVAVKPHDKYHFHSGGFMGQTRRV